MELQFGPYRRQIRRLSYVCYASDGETRFPCIVPFEHLADLAGGDDDRAIIRIRSRLESDLQRQYEMAGLDDRGELIWNPFDTSNPGTIRQHTSLPASVMSQPAATNVAMEPASNMQHSCKVFISYAWESVEHKAWVRELAAKLGEDGIDVILDQTHLVLGDPIPDFMERAIRDSNFVLMIWTPAYKSKSDTRSGGVGYEGHIITGEVFHSQNDRKFIPLLRSGDWHESSPTWASGKLGADFRGDNWISEQYQVLLNTLRSGPLQPPTHQGPRISLLGA